MPHAKFTDDTVMTIAVAETYYGLPEKIKDSAFHYLAEALINVCQEFEKLKVENFKLLK